MIIQFTIPGTPQQQGTKVKNRYGAIYDENKDLASWRRDALISASKARPAGYAGPVFTGPVEVVMVAHFPRPKSHYGSGRNAGVLKPNAPFWVTTKPDADKVQRALGDALEQSGIVQADQLIVHWDASKVYGTPARMDVTVSDASDLLAAAPPADAEELYDDDLLAGRP
jgi:crossover junction endodeoxyribonuclease RusA